MGVFKTFLGGGGNNPKLRIRGFFLFRHFAYLREPDSVEALGGFGCLKCLKGLNAWRFEKAPWLEGSQRFFLKFEVQQRTKG